ncbi:MAG: geranylgeranylglycerol-phosphate geranylgeranyltransferase [Bacteroidales bacterium]|nr:geranylgeranylglycerol-phosphate geranylgeranyltransferase [Bacteroidales bacterium]MCF8390514.1 geranylgeranylglycerol-phosphate geranylgeranyltransferase [Bacteroidales bacterium]
MINSFFKLLRVPNLLIIAATQYLIRYFIIKPFLSVNNFELQFSDFHFFLLVLSTILIAAGGYAINDYFDTKTDRLNKPSRVVIDVKISRGFAIKIHSALSVIGVLIGVYLSFYIGIPMISVVFFLASGLLWFYSMTYKKEFLIGNLIVSLLTGIVPIMVVLFEIPLLNKVYGEIMLRVGSNFNYIFYWVLAFGFFAFTTNFIREIIKDAEDFEGDSAYGMNTIPIVLGIRTSKIIINVLSFLFLASLVFLLLKYIVFTGSGFDYISSLYFALLIFLPTLFIIYKVTMAKTKEDYHLASAVLKFIMLFGILYSVVVFIIMEYKLN